LPFPGDVGETHGQCANPAPQRTLRLVGGFPGVFEHFVGVERQSRIQQPLRLGQRFLGFPLDALRLSLDAVRA